MNPEKNPNIIREATENASPMQEAEVIQFPGNELGDNIAEEHSAKDTNLPYFLNKVKNGEVTFEELPHHELLEKKYEVDGRKLLLALMAIDSQIPVLQSRIHELEEKLLHDPIHSNPISFREEIAVKKRLVHEYQQLLKNLHSLERELLT
jgi:hypothetical protein